MTCRGRSRRGRRGPTAQRSRSDSRLKVTRSCAGRLADRQTRSRGEVRWPPPGGDRLPGRNSQGYPNPQPTPPPRTRYKPWEYQAPTGCLSEPRRAEQTGLARRFCAATTTYHRLIRPRPPPRFEQALYDGPLVGGHRRLAGRRGRTLPLPLLFT